VLAPIIVDAINEALDIVLAHAAAVMAARSKAHADLGHGVSERAEQRRLARMAEPPPTQNAGGYLTKSCAPGEGKLGGQIVDSGQIVAPLQHAEADHITDDLEAGSRPSRVRLVSRNGRDHTRRARRRGCDLRPAVAVAVRLASSTALTLSARTP